MTEPATATRDFSSLGVGSLVNGAAAFGFATTATHAFGSTGSSAFVVLWTFWLAATAVLTFPVQHWLILRGALGTPRRALSILSMLAGGLLFVVCAAFRSQLFHSSSFVFPLVAGAIAAGAVPVGVCRGRLIATGQARRTAIFLGSENILRLVGGLLVVAFSGSIEIFSIAILLGYAVLPMYRQAWHSSSESGDRDDRLVEAFRSIGFVGASTLVAQLVLAGGPLLVAASGAPATIVTATFATLEVCGSAYLLASGASLRFTAILAEQRDSLSLRRVGWTVSAVGCAVAPIIAGAAYVVGPQVVGIFFGKAAKLPASSTTLIAAGSVLAVVALLLLLVAFAEERSAQVLSTWIAATVVGGILYGVTSSTAAGLRFGIAFFVVECLAVLGLTGIVSVPPSGKPNREQPASDEPRLENL